MSSNALALCVPHLPAPLHACVPRGGRLQNIRLSAMRKVQRMPRLTAAAKMSLTASRALVCQTVAIFLVDELFLIGRLGWRER